MHVNLLEIPNRLDFYWHFIVVLNPQQNVHTNSLQTPPSWRTLFHPVCLKCHLFKLCVILSYWHDVNIFEICFNIYCDFLTLHHTANSDQLFSTFLKKAANKLPAGYPLPQVWSSGRPMFSANTQFWTAISLVTLAQILAALTIGNNESAFFSTLIFSCGNICDSFSYNTLIRYSIYFSRKSII